MTIDILISKGVRGFQKGHSVPKEIRDKIGLANSISLKGHIPWNKGKKGIIHSGSFRKGYVLPQESIEKMRLTKTNVPWSEARRKAQLNIRDSLLKRPKKPLIKNGKEYPFNWAEIRKNVYRRDSWECQECGVHCYAKNKIQCHHIDYDTTNNAFSNLITLCSSCHAKTNWQREDWEKHYKSLMGVRGLIATEN